ncbi:MAG: transketolase [Paracoccaceae bacterium]
MEIDELRKSFQDHWSKATAIRMLSIDAVQAANSGHPGMPMGMADVATVLFENHLKFDSSEPRWIDRDRFVLSAGHGSMLLYSLLYLTGYADITLDEIKRFRQLGSKTAGHPEFGHAQGIETTTGPLGQGLATAVGIAMAEVILSNRWGQKLINHRTYVIAGDGCLMEGISQEAITLAGKHKLSKLIVLWDNNNITIDGDISKSCITDQIKRFESAGWSTFECDGHNPIEINNVINLAKNDSCPSLISCKTTIGFGSPSKGGTAGIHGSPLGLEEIALVREIYGWSHPPFEIPKDVKDSWLTIGLKNACHRKDWEKNLTNLSTKKRTLFLESFSDELPLKLRRRASQFKKSIILNHPTIATRKASELALEVINNCCTNTIGGSADLTGSNNTLTPNLGIFSPENPTGRYIHYGIREHGMAAAMNGLALHGGLIPYGGTFLAFTDYARGGMRLSSIMGLRVIYVMTHDSIGLGEDGPTHQPVEHLAMLRATPNMQVFRPADPIETMEAWEIALQSNTCPSTIALSRQNLPTLRTKYTSKNLTKMGAYILSEANGTRRAVLVATGSEVAIAMEAKRMLEDDGIGTRVVSMPCWELFDQQDEKYQRKILPSRNLIIAIEASVSMGWEKWLNFGQKKNKANCFIGMKGFGASAPAKELYNHFGINSQSIFNKVKNNL